MANRARLAPRVLLGLGLLMAAAIYLYLIASWLQAANLSTNQRAFTMINRWLVLRPTWLYLLLLILFTVVAIIAALYGLASLLPPRGAWRAVVTSQAQSIQHELSIYTPRKAQEDEIAESVREAVTKHLKAACDAANPPSDSVRPPTDRLVDAWTGTSIEAAYLNLHAAEVALVPLLPAAEIKARIPEALVRLERCPPNDERRRAAQRVLKNLKGPLTDEVRAAYANTVRLGYEIKDAEHARIRSFRNILLSATMALSGVALLLCVIGARFPDAIPLCFSPSPTTTSPQGSPSTPTPGAAATQENTVCPSEEQPPSPRRIDERRLPAPGDVGLTAVFGLLGGALSGAFAIRRLWGSSIPYGVPVALSMLKLPSGALTAIVGLLLVRGEFVPGLSQLDNQPQILAYAFIFGFAQQIATRYIDNQAQEILGKVPAKEDASDTQKTDDRQDEQPSGADASDARRTDEAQDEPPTPQSSAPMAPKQPRPTPARLRPRRPQRR